MASFHPFPRLPYELRVHIWELTVQPRTVEVRFITSDISYPPYLVSSTPIPSILQTSREPRNLNLYAKTFTSVIYNKTRGHQYVWANLDIDIISIGDIHELELFASLKPGICRLQFERNLSWDAFFDLAEINIGLPKFEDVKEVRVLCVEGIQGCEGLVKWYKWPSCGREGVFLVDGKDGRIARAIEV